MVSRRTWARLQLLVGALGLAYQLWGYRAGRQYAAAVAAGDRPPRETLQDRHQELIDQTDNIEDVDLWEMMASQNRAAFAEMYGDTQLQARWVAVGGVRGVVQSFVLDFAIFGTRTSFPTESSTASSRSPWAIERPASRADRVTSQHTRRPSTRLRAR